MREFQEKKRFKRILYSKGTIFVLVIAIVFFSRATWGVYKKEQESAANALQAENSLKRLEDRQKVLNDELTKLQTEEGVEEEIRSKYGVSKPGERVLIIVDDQKATTSLEVPKKGLWQKFKGLFK
ncbi:septum formation initiator family protein [Candidatus Parcubacteria bacterium]|nr:septum formation initiator family protein [Candidatus Parcubacteria bacterium]